MGAPPSFPPFEPHPLLRHAHAMTIVPRFWPRGDLLAGIPVEHRLFSVAQSTQLLGWCHWQLDRQRHPTVLLVHGLEGCSESHYMHGIAAKAYRAGLNVIRLNQRTCGGTEHLTPTLYNSGMSEDYKAIVAELYKMDGLPEIWLAGYSMGGNLALKLAGEVGSTLPGLRGVLAVCPLMDPGQCVVALEKPENRLYHYYFLRRLKRRLQRKAELFPGLYDASDLSRVGSVREFDDRYTAPHGGYAGVVDYYDRAGARHVVGKICVPTLILIAQDDPVIPFSMFGLPALRENPWIALIATERGGHCGFFQRRRGKEDHYWAEYRLIDFMVMTTPHRHVQPVRPQAADLRWKATPAAR